MNYVANPIAIAIFLTFVGFVLGMSFYYARKAKSAEGYFAAGGTIHWFVNGIAFAGDYLSAASFLGICGLIATMGYDGFLYSIGYLAGWIVALFVVAEPMKRLGKYTFTDALDAKFNSKGIQLMAAISTLAVSLFYLIPQMVGAGVLVTPLLGLPHWVGVIMVGAIVITIVATAGMTSTTYVQFLKGGLLIIFSTVISVMVLNKGLSTETRPETFVPRIIAASSVTTAATVEYHDQTFVKVVEDGLANWWIVEGDQLLEAQSKVVTASGETLYNGAPKADNKFKSVGHLTSLTDEEGNEITETGRVGIFKYFASIDRSEVVRYPKDNIAKFDDNGDHVKVFCPVVTKGSDLLVPGQKFKTKTPIGKLNFISLMLALFCGTASLPHILIRYYTVPSQRDARKSTIVAIASIGFFYVLTLFLGFGAMTLGVIDVESGNMSAPLLAKAFGIVLFSIISAIAFATVLGTVSGLIVAASGAVAHDLMDNYFAIKMTDTQKVKAGKLTAVVVGILAVGLGIAFKGMNVSFLVGWAFAVAASANLPSIIMLLFWPKTTAKGIAWSIGVGMVSALGIILTSPSMYAQYGLDKATALHTLDNPGIISIPLSFIVLIVASLMTQKDNEGLEYIG
ncbi:solute symporter family protein [Pontiella sulfatireligans]|uniref:Cation/acetate symporter ActP n=1 Tax=Pontiella sulfatireligans TaxID=2750658 RepID=A0A6C2URS8_9BACT|nr:cation acetate symporter [Pontiella sulfatireligans]VGO21636.1 Cation/acetate symporter ActP [Pontiella sulfatireligans]